MSVIICSKVVLKFTFPVGKCLHATVASHQFSDYVAVKATTRSQTHGRGSLRRDGARRGERRRGRMRKMFIGGEQFSLLTIKHNLVLSRSGQRGFTWSNNKKRDSTEYGAMSEVNLYSIVFNQILNFMFKNELKILTLKGAQ